MQKNQEFLGTLELLSEQEVIVSCPTTVVLQYTAGEYGIDENGGIRLAWRTVSDWEQPQFQDPEGFGYTTIQTSADAILEASRSAYQRPYHNCIQLRIRDGNVNPGDTVRIVLGDTSKGSPGIRAQSFAETAHEFLLAVDPFNTNLFQQLPQSVKIQVKNGPVNEVNLVVPTTVEAGEAFSYTVRVLDEWGNPCKDFVGEVKVSSPTGTKLQETVEFTEEDGGCKRVEGNVIHQPGEYSFHAECLSHELYCDSNPCVCRDGQPYRLYWGDMHGQTDLTIGTGSLDEYYRFAKGPGALDFTGWQGNDFEIDHERWNMVRQKTEEYNQEKEFLVYLGYEWSGNHSGGGDHNVWFMSDEDHFYPSSHWSRDRDFAEGDRWDRYPVNKMFDEYRGRRDVMIVPHIGGRPANLEFCDTDVIHNIEIHSHHGTFEWFAKEAMKRKLKIGFVASSDDHTCRPGLSYPLCNTGQEVNAFDTKSGLVAVYAKELTKEAIWEALQARRCYAVTFNRMLLDVRVAGAFMGEEIVSSEPPQVDVTVIGQVPIDHVEIYRDDQMVYQHYNYVAEKNGRKRVKILWSGVRSIGRKKLAVWDGHLFLDKGRILHAEEIAFDTFQQGITYRSNQQISWKSSTSGDYDGILLELDCPDDAVLKFYSPQKNLEIPLEQLEIQPVRYDAGGVNLKVEASLAGEHPVAEQGNPNKLSLSWKETDEAVKEGAYWVKVVQDNGQMAFSSPVFVTVQQKEASDD